MRFFSKLSLIICTLILLDIGIGKILHYILLNIRGGIQASTTYAITKADQQLIILGSSRAQHHYIPSIFKNTLKLNSYNAGCDGMTFLYYYSIFKSILARESPKVVIVDLLPTEFVKSDKNYTCLASLLPYYNSDPAIRPVLNLRSPFERVKSLSNLYRYNSIIGPLIRDLMIGEHANDGYIPLYGGLEENAALGNANSSGNDIDSIMVNKFEDMIQTAKASNLKLFVFISPTYQDYRYPQKSISIAESICSMEGVYFKDFSQDKLFLNKPEYFANTFHLNNKGASIYSKIIASDIEKDITSDPPKAEEITKTLAKISK